MEDQTVVGAVRTAMLRMAAMIRTRNSHWLATINPNPKAKGPSRSTLWVIGRRRSLSVCAT